MFGNPLATFFLGIVCALFLQGLHILIVWFLSKPLGQIGLTDYAKGLEKYIHKKRDPENEKHTLWLKEVQEYRSQLAEIHQKLKEIAQEMDYPVGKRNN